jgi:hypothetical protein
VATFDEGARRWRIDGGTYRISAGFDAEQLVESVPVTLPRAELPP